MTTPELRDDAGALAELAAASRALGADPRLVLHGGGNSSLKTTGVDIDGSPVATLWVKGSGHDMATITEAGFAPLRLELLRRLLPPTVVPDSRLRSELRCALLDADAPDPSVETLVHAALPQAAVLHSHADAVLALGASRGREQVAEALGPSVLLVDYAMPGPDLVAAIAAAWQSADTSTVGLLVLGHGLFTVGDSPQQALERHLAVVRDAEHAIGPWPEPAPSDEEPLDRDDAIDLARLRADVCRAAGRPMIMVSRRDDRVAAFLADPDRVTATQEGPLTPDHALWTKPWPLIGTDVDDFAARYRAYVDRHRGRRGEDLILLDPAPRVIVDDRFGLLGVGRGPAEAQAAVEIYAHTMDAIELAQRGGGYRGGGEDHVFDLEYWSFQQQKLRRSGDDSSLAGQVALVTGAASGIGKGCAQALLDAGACVVGWDLSPAVVEAFDTDRFVGVRIDVTDPDAVAAGVTDVVARFGGLDMLVVAAGIFPTSANLGELSAAQWRKTMAVNVDSVMELYGQAGALLAHAQPYGRVVLIASRNATAPGPGAAAYSSSKAAVTQLSRVAALEWANAGVRVNMLHPDAVFDTGLWTPELLAARAEHYGMSVEQYKRRNLLHAEITSAKVGLLCRSLCSPEFECTTGAQIPIDGGNERVI